jgi:hypothetical protein
MELWIEPIVLHSLSHAYGRPSSTSLLRRVFWNNIFYLELLHQIGGFISDLFWTIFWILNTIFEFKFYLEFKSIPSKELQTQLI